MDLPLKFLNEYGVVCDDLLHTENIYKHLIIPNSAQLKIVMRRRNG